MKLFPRIPRSKLFPIIKLPFDCEYVVIELSMILRWRKKKTGFLSPLIQHSYLITKTKKKGRNELFAFPGKQKFCSRGIMLLTALENVALYL